MAPERAAPARTHLTALNEDRGQLPRALDVPVVSDRRVNHQDADRNTRILPPEALSDVPLARVSGLASQRPSSRRPTIHAMRRYPLSGGDVVENKSRITGLGIDAELIPTQRAREFPAPAAGEAR